MLKRQLDGQGRAQKTPAWRRSLEVIRERKVSEAASTDENNMEPIYCKDESCPWGFQHLNGRKRSQCFQERMIQPIKRVEGSSEKMPSKCSCHSVTWGPGQPRRNPCWGYEWGGSQTEQIKDCVESEGDSRGSSWFQVIQLRSTGKRSNSWQWKLDLETYNDF